jgi:hypothetical protein
VSHVKQFSGSIRTDRRLAGFAMNSSDSFPIRMFERGQQPAATITATFLLRPARPGPQSGKLRGNHRPLIHI